MDIFICGVVHPSRMANVSLHFVCVKKNGGLFCKVEKWSTRVHTTNVHRTCVHNTSVHNTSVQSTSLYMCI